MSRFCASWRRSGRVTVAFLATLATATLAPAQGPLPSVAPGESVAPQPLPEVSITEHAGDKIPADAVFFDQNGRRIRLGDYLQDGKPVILTLNYYRCPMLCGLVLNGVAKAIKDQDLEIGKDYRVVTISIDPAETPSLARQKGAMLTKFVDKPGAAEGWAFLTGEQHAIDAVAQATGFGYQWVESERQFAHPAAVMIITPDGTISRYLYPGGAAGSAQALNYDAKTLRLSLVEASEGKIGSAMDQILLTCFHFDPATGHYKLAMGTMRTGGALTVVALLSIVAAFLIREHRARAANPATADQPASDA